MFKNITFMQFPRNWAASDDVERGLQPIEDPAPIELRRVGFTPVLPDDERLLVRAPVGYLLAMEIRERKLPAAVVAKEVRKRAEAREVVGKKALRRLHDEVFTELLPRALIHSRRVDVWIHPEQGVMAVDAASSALCEQVCLKLREILATFPAIYPSPQGSISLRLRHVAEGDSFEQARLAPTGAVLWLESAERQARLKEWTPDNVVSDLLSEGLHPERMSVTVAGLMQAVLDTGMRLRSVKLLDGGVDKYEEMEDHARFVSWLLNLTWQTLHSEFNCYDSPPPINEDLA